MFKPVLLDNVFDARDYDRLRNDTEWFQRRNGVNPDPDFGRVISNDQRLYLWMERLLPLARELFSDDTILPSYACWAKYSSEQSRLPAHKDKNACTFTIDYCVAQHEPWMLFVEGEPYTLLPNQALAFMGEDQEHWRPAFKRGNMVEMIFFHFVRPDHWYFQD